MDSNKSGAPPGFEDEKSAAALNPPPAYHDYPGAAQPLQQGYGYPQQQGVVYNQQPYPSQQHPGQPAPISMQPTVYVTQAPLTSPVNDYLGYSIFTMLCCCLPLGIAALVFSIFTREANHSGDRMSAERSSRTARTLNHVALGLGIGSLILLIIYVAVLMNVVAKQ
ncbi:PREDICTED: proline-rich transmembrane protein 1-like [Cyprinodon variegatus]|uniref:proline-rich transmembrane protein 1-like n=1 Tax=Cyprinodon variegatus TaxID=28743 RepID=UPI000742B6B4|nr:PREDICTED: proline-rich transmembrane protein 1-like [Cyprinodon variegatus]